MVRLIKTSDLSLHIFEGRSIPEYAILSHRWEDGEITLQELVGNFNHDKAGWQKLRSFCQYASQHGHEFVWMDTCCIDKTSSAELSEAINSMFKWYRRATICYAYLSDVPAKDGLSGSEWMEMFRGSEWFKRGWTLQELLAPKKLVFVCSSWEQEIGTRESLSEEVAAITSIPQRPLISGWSLKDGFGATQFTVAQIMSWASERRTTRIEDMAYSLMGLFCINMPLLYGEGPNAFTRLQLEIMSKYDDHSLFAWKIPYHKKHFDSIWELNDYLDIPAVYWWGGLLAPTVQCFQGCASHFLHLEKLEDGRQFTMTNRGIRVEGLLRRYKRSRHGPNSWLLPLNCGRDERWGHQFGVILAGDGQFAMRVVNIQGVDPDLVEFDRDKERSSKAEYEHQTFYIPQAWPGDFD